MKVLIITFILGVLITLGVYIYTSKPCLAGICPSVACVNSWICGDGCVCGKDLGEAMGKCYSASRADELSKQGLQILQ